MIVDIVDKYLTDDNNPIKNLRLKLWVGIFNSWSSEVWCQVAESSAAELKRGQLKLRAVGQISSMSKNAKKRPNIFSHVQFSLNS